MLQPLATFVGDDADITQERLLQLSEVLDITVDDKKWGHFVKGVEIIAKTLKMEKQYVTRRVMIDFDRQKISL